MTGELDRSADAVELQPGQRLRSQVCATELIVTRAPRGQISLSCGGHPLVALGADRGISGPPAPGFAQGTELGKRYRHVNSDGSILEVLVTKAGAGSLAADGRCLAMLEPRVLPASD